MLRRSDVPHLHAMSEHALAVGLGCVRFARGAHPREAGSPRPSRLLQLTPHRSTYQKQCSETQVSNTGAKEKLLTQLLTWAKERQTGPRQQSVLLRHQARARWAQGRLAYLAAQIGLGMHARGKGSSSGALDSTHVPVPEGLQGVSKGRPKRLAEHTVRRPGRHRA